MKIPIYGLDKIVHGTIHFILINLWMLYFYVKNDFRFKVKSVLLLFLSLMLFGIIVEILQGQLTDSRGADIFDIAANLTGSLLGILFFKIAINNLNLKKFN
ncbi:MAG: VanZ family protein [Aequorivita sp.]